MQDSAAAPETPKAPTLSENIQDYIKALPDIISAQKQYGPQMEQQTYDTQKQFAPQYQALQDSLNPELAALRKQLTSQATTGAQNGGLPDYLKQQYLDQFRAEAGGNNGAGIGADYVSRNFVNQAEAYKQQNQNLGLSLIGAQPLYQAGQAGQAASSVGQGYNAGAALNYGASTYGNYVGAYANMYGANAGITGINNKGYFDLASSFIGGSSNAAGAKAAGPAAAAGCWVAAELFGGWLHPKTICARFYVNFIAPKWFKEFYLKFGENIASYISNKPFLKKLLLPIFERFAIAGEKAMNGR